MFGLGKDKYIDLFEEAAEANLKDIHRNGDLLILPKTGDTIISGDIHGNLENYDRIVQVAALDTHPERHLIVHELIHNIYRSAMMPDNSWEILIDLAELKCEYPNNVHIVIGNHELSEIQGKGIMKNGQKIPLIFGDDSDNKKFGKKVSEIKAAVLRFMRTQLVGVRHRGGVWMSHSIPAKRIHEFSLSLFERGGSKVATLAKSQEQFKEHIIEDLTWGRDYSDAIVSTFKEKVQARCIVVGHEPCDKGFGRPHKDVVILDSKDEHAVFLYLKNDKAYTSDEVMKSVRHLHKQAGT
ncbi:MAG: metallophosphoesterase [Planctomycetota bacterium]